MLEISDKALAEFGKVLGVAENMGLSVRIEAHEEGPSCCSCSPSRLRLCRWG